VGPARHGTNLIASGSLNIDMIRSRWPLGRPVNSWRIPLNLRFLSGTTYDAALAAYRDGVGTVDAATAADTALLDAREAQADAHARSA
jgi:hypothetical protein